MPERLTMAEVPVAILAGGLATRLGPIAAKVPKALVEVAGRPFIDHQLALLRRNGVRRVVVCVGHLGEQVERHLGDGRGRGIAVRYAYDGPTPLGTGGALRRALPLLGEVFWVVYGDSYTDIDFRAVLDAFGRRPGAAGLLTVIRNAGRWDASNVRYARGRPLRYDKAAPTPDMAHIDYGVSLLRRPALASYPEGTFLDLADVFRDLSAAGLLAGFPVRRRFYEVGTPRGLEETRKALSRGGWRVARGA